MNGLYLWSKIYSLKEDRCMKHDCLGGLPGRETCIEEKTETVRTDETSMKLAQVCGRFEEDRKPSRGSRKRKQWGEKRNVESYHSKREP